MGTQISLFIFLPYSSEKMVDYSVSAFSARELDRGVIGFQSGTPAIKLFPRSKWNRIANQAVLDAPVSALGYDYPQGRPELRRVLALYLKKTRGLSVDPERIIITTGAKQGLTLAAKCLLKNPSRVSSLWAKNRACT